MSGNIWELLRKIFVHVVKVLQPSRQNSNQHARKRRATKFDCFPRFCFTLLFFSTLRPPSLLFLLGFILLTKVSFVIVCPFKSAIGLLLLFYQCMGKRTCFLLCKFFQETLLAGKKFFHATTDSITQHYQEKNQLYCPCATTFFGFSMSFLPFFIDKKLAIRNRGH